MALKHKRKCVLDFCDKDMVVLRLGYCSAHYAQVTRYGFEEPVPIRTFEKNKKCDAPWCARMVYEKSLCTPCYKKTRRYNLTS
jgi:hypothetical protein